MLLLADLIFLLNFQVASDGGDTQESFVSCQLSVASCQLSVVSCQLSVVSCHWSFLLTRD
ncbi:asr4108 [Nostoc sp. PCC 7120 = FACHB-418]|nr:asr4108 [Nostoc sp. PCC 7120 = FACHB-418]